MDQPLKLNTDLNSKKELGKQILEIVDFQQHPRIKVNDTEKYLLKAFKRPKYPSFHEVIGPVLTGFVLSSHLQFHPRRKFILEYSSFFSVGQCFGNLPTMGTLDRDFQNISFKWYSLRTIYAIVYLLIGSFEVGLMIFKGFSKGFNIEVAGEKVGIKFYTG